MKTALHFLLTLWLGLWLALPSPGGEGGENAGGTGVWILPRATFLPATPQPEVRASFVAMDLSKNVRMRVSSEVGTVVATYVDDVIGQPCALPVVGDVVGFPAALLQSLASSPTSSGSIVIADAEQRGYVIHVRWNSSKGGVEVIVE
jgi:hypothetical protein